MAAVTTTIASFPTSTGSGAEPDGQLFIDSNGDLRGATVHGGANGIGTTYEIAKIAGGYATTPTFLADIPVGLNTLVGVPNLGADANGDLFGLMITGGANSLGSVVEFPSGGGTVTLPTTFAGGAGGSNPGGRLLVDASGNLFGTTLSGGAHNAGTVFEIKKTGGVYASAPTVLTSFASGITPSGLGNLVEDAAGNLFGTTTSSVFEVRKTGANSYATPVSLVPFPVGTQIGSLAIDAKGDIFGTTVTGGASDNGTVFEIEKTATGYASTPTTLASFTPADGKLSLNRPKTLIIDANGDLFGTTDPSAQNSGGVVFEIVRTSTGYESLPTIVS
ncbi:MAG TPA: choice-of-anchor tandem repeat GloVer-containing protein, partial [Roseiarcus sp.]|nr:choice-of-anchor tandem repeat GloVer-containing protein [Roseiarcus sp.]